MARTMAEAVDQRVVFFMKTPKMQNLKRRSIVKRACGEIGRISMQGDR